MEGSLLIPRKGFIKSQPVACKPTAAMYVYMSYKCFFFSLSVPNIRDKGGNEKKVVDVNKGKDVKLICQVKQNGVITSWLKNNRTISPLDHPRMRLKLNKYLKIKRVQKEDAGFYTCVAENNCGRNTYTMQLFVGSKLTLLNTYFVSGNIEIRGKQNSPFPKGPVIKGIVIFFVFM